MPGTVENLPAGYIPGAIFFDVDQVAAPSPMAHMLPTAEIFKAHVDQMGIRDTDHVIVYDRHGLRGAPRVWWTFRMFGHENVSVLEGGLPTWIAAGHEVVEDQSHDWPQSDYQIRPARAKVVSQTEILKLLQSKPQILDARAKGRFEGSSPEPREGLRSGRIPGSRNWPFSDLFDAPGYLKSKDKLKAQIETLGIDLEKPIITSCGSGITAAGLALALEILGANDVSLYDGSWTEWGASDAPIDTGPAQNG